MCRQLSLLPLMHEFDKKDGFMFDTTYWEIEEYKNNEYYLIFHTDYYSLLLHERSLDWIENTTYSWVVVITKGNYNGKENCYEIKFHRYSGETYSIFLTEDQFNCETPIKEGWHGKFNLYVNGQCKQQSPYVYYRSAETLPCSDPVEGLQENLQKAEDDYNA